jgi:hypothetical protein
MNVAFANATVQIPDHFPVHFLSAESRTQRSLSQCQEQARVLGILPIILLRMMFMDLPTNKKERTTPRMKRMSSMGSIGSVKGNMGRVSQRINIDHRIGIVSHEARDGRINISITSYLKQSLLPLRSYT